MGNGALPGETEVPVVIFQVPLGLTSIKNYPEDDAIQAGATEELKLAL